MKRFEYDVSVHRADAFRELVFFCSSSGECSPEQISADHVEKLKDLLNDQGRDGWELVQLVFDQNGLMAFWKRERK